MSAAVAAAAGLRADLGTVDREAAVHGLVGLVIDGSSRYVRERSYRSISADLISSELSDRERAVKRSGSPRLRPIGQDSARPMLRLSTSPF